MLAAARLLEIEEQFGEYIRSIVPPELDGETLRLILHLENDVVFFPIEVLVCLSCGERYYD